MRMDKQILKDYIDACELVKETEEDIQALEVKKKQVEHICVKGSNPEFPYQEQHFSAEGTAFSWADDASLRDELKALAERKRLAEQIRARAQQEINRAPARIQRIIRFRYIKNMSWEKVADRMGRGSTGDSVRMELDRFFSKK